MLSGDAPEMAVKAMRRHLRNTRSEEFRCPSGSLDQPQRLHSEPAHVPRPQWQQDQGHEGPEVQLSGAASPPRGTVHLGDWQQSQTHDAESTQIASSAENTAVTGTDRSTGEHPITRRILPRVVQPVVSLGASTSEAENIPPEPTRKSQDVSISVASMATMLPESQPLPTDNRLESPPGPVVLQRHPRPPPPERGPGHETKSDKKHTARPSVQDSVTPPLQHSSISVQKQWRMILRLQATAASTRHELRICRQKLRFKEDIKLAADDRLMTRLQLIGANQSSFTNDKSISELLNDCQRARDEYGPLQDDCVLLEDKLNLQEYHLHKAEEIFFQQIPFGEPEVEEDDSALSGNGSDGSESFAYSDDDSDIGRDYHPRAVEFLTNKGRVSILYERLIEIREERDTLEEEKETRLRVGLGLYPEDQEFLDTWDDIEAELLDDIERAEAVAEKLGEECLRDGLIDDEGNANVTIESRERQNFRQEPEIYAGSETSEIIKYPVLLPQYGTPDLHVKNPQPERNGVSYNTSDRINDWLLIHLLSSPLDVNLLARTYEVEVGPIESPDDWQNDVLTLWFNDETKKTHRTYLIQTSERLSQVSALIKPQVQAGDAELTPLVSDFPAGESLMVLAAPKDEDLLIGLGSQPFVPTISQSSGGRSKKAV